MKAHELARLLLAGPDLPVVISTGSVEDEDEEVEGKLTTRLESYHPARYGFRTTSEHILLS